jgi:hypothetical protein
MTLFTHHNFAAKSDAAVGFKTDSTVGTRGLLVGETSVSGWTLSYCPTNPAEIADMGRGQLPRARQIGQALRSL